MPRPADLWSPTPRACGGGCCAARGAPRRGCRSTRSIRPATEWAPDPRRRDHDPEVRRHLPLLIGGRFSSNLLLRFPAPFLGVIAGGLGTSVGVMGLALSAGEFAGLGAPAVGRAADRRGPRLAMGVGLGLVHGRCAARRRRARGVVFAVAMVVVQLSKVSFDAATTSWIADRVPFGRRSEVTGLVETSWAMALLVGVPVLGLRGGPVRVAWGYVAIALLCGPAAVGAWRRIPDETPTAEAGAGARRAPPRRGPAW